MKREYISLFEKAAPRMSDEELFNAVLNSRKGSITMKNNTQNTEHKSKKFFSKAVVIPLAAALALGATAVGAVAVYNHNVNEEYARVLQREDYGYKWQELKDNDGNVVDENVKALSNGLYDRLNIEINQTFECDGFTLEFPGAISDGESMIVFYNLTFNEGQEFYPNDQFGLMPKDYYFGSEKVTTDGRADNGILQVIDGKTVYNGCISLRNIETVTEDVLSINFVQLSSCVSKIGEDVSRFDLDVTVDIPLSSDLTQFNKTVDIASAPHIDIGNWGDWDVDSVKITPLTLTFNMSADHETPEPRVIKDFWPVYPVELTFKDGSVLDLTNQIGGAGIDDEERTFVRQLRLDYPIDVENVATIQFASAVISMDGSATTVEIPEVVERFTNGN